MDAMTPKLDTSIDRLIKMMGMTTSDNDGQALVAIRAANTLLRKLNTDWDSVLRGKVSIIADPFGDIPVVHQRPTPPPHQPAPPKAQAQPWQPKPPPRPQSPPPPPPRPTPVAWPKSKEIDGWFAILSLRTYPAKTTQSIRFARDRYDRDSGLMTNDYFYIQGLVKKSGVGSIGDL